MKKGDRVRHRRGGWLATVILVYADRETIVVTADESRHLDGEYSASAFEVVDES